MAIQSIFPTSHFESGMQSVINTGHSTNVIQPASGGESRSVTWQGFSNPAGVRTSVRLKFDYSVVGIFSLGNSNLFLYSYSIAGGFPVTAISRSNFQGSESGSVDIALDNNQDTSQIAVSGFLSVFNNNGFPTRIEGAISNIRIELDIAAAPGGQLNSGASSGMM